MNNEDIIRGLAVNQCLLNMILMKLGFTQKEVLEMTNKAYEVYNSKMKEQNENIQE